MDPIWFITQILKVTHESLSILTHLIKKWFSKKLKNKIVTTAQFLEEICIGELNTFEIRIIMLQKKKK